MRHFVTRYCPNCDAELAINDELLACTRCWMEWDRCYLTQLPTRPIGPIARQAAFDQAWAASQAGR